MSKFLKYCNKILKSTKAKKRQKVLAKFGKSIDAIDIKIKKRLFIVNDIQEAKKK
ncbi:uncharacterized protein METZ01_LOCUS473132 [marine metagenome]|uniref:Uncharacterized protein n=1 Tax=marine metagenome TaxID=408172 RepID=A0A383BLK9_9ZZZZ